MLERSDPQQAPLATVLVHLGQRLKDYRIARSLTQEELAQQAGISRRSVANLEHGASGSVETLVRVLRALGHTDRLLLLVPDTTLDPFDPMLERKKKRQRVRTKAPHNQPRAPWSWGRNKR